MRIKNLLFNLELLFNPEIDVSEYSIFSSKLEEETEENVVLIGDLHGYQNDFEKSKKLIEVIKKQNPHHIIIAGDIMQGKKWENDNDLSNLQLFLEILSKTAPVYIILGNHDTYGWNEKNTAQRKNNYDQLREPGKIYPLFNTREKIGPFNILGLVPSHYLMSSLSIQISGRAHDLLIKECIENGIPLDGGSDTINEIICHNPHNLFQTGRPSDNEFSYDISYNAHTHGGSIPTAIRKKHPDILLDMGIVERPYTINQDGKIVRVNPFIYAKTNLCDGLIFTDRNVQQRFLQLQGENYYQNIATDLNKLKWHKIAKEDFEHIVRTKELSANVITTGIRKIGFDICTHKPEVTVVKIIGTKPKIEAGKIKQRKAS